VTNSENETAKFDLHSEDLLDVRLRDLLRLFPEVHTESGGVNFDALRLALGDSVEVGPESFGMSWPGKAECAKTIQRQSVATLLPAEDESVDWGTTQNVIIEGDNLEVLKVLQKAYLGKVKMIYIDPPYNTGNDFIYPDTFAESLQTYLEYSGQTDGEGRKYSTNAETSGRYHSKWLNMMYPRLAMSRNLLREDGVIFVSINDVEVSRLRHICDEVFGEENLVAQIPWQARTSVQNDTDLSAQHEYIVAYAKNRRKSDRRLKESNFTKWFLEQTFAVLPNPSDPTRFANPDDDPRGPWKADPFDAPNVRPNLTYAITNPKTGEEHWPPKGRCWRTEESTFRDLLSQERIVFGKSGDSRPQLKVFYEEKKIFGEVPTTWFSGEKVGTTSSGTADLEKLFGTTQLFPFPKPTSLLQTLLQMATRNDDLILDFFAGSGSMGHAVIKQNELDGASRRFILVQLPEPAPVGSYAEANGFATIAEITKERMRRVLNSPSRDLGLPTNSGVKNSGFRVFRLERSNFAVWDANAIEGDETKLEHQLFSQVEQVLSDRTSQDILFELMLKSRYELTTPVEQVKVGDCEVWKVAAGEMVAIIDSGLTVEVIREIATWKPLSVVILDRSFGADDSLKSNARKIFEDEKIDLKTV
jgi:adenine-specific DNA-methyltransferase